MKKIISGLIATFAISTFSFSTAHATLIDRGNGMIYDSDQNITWLQDANYAKTSGYDADGRMTWDASMTWVDQLIYGGFSDWRLATITDKGNNGCNWSYNGTDCGYNVDTSGSELAYLYYNILGNIADYDINGNHLSNHAIQFTSADGVSFQNVQSYAYWSGTEYALFNSFA